MSILEEKFSSHKRYRSVKYRFSTRDQFSDESAINYFFAIKNLNDQIIFGPQTNLKLLTRFIQGLKNREICKMLRPLPTLTVYNTVQTAMKMESGINPLKRDLSSKEKNLLKQLEREEGKFFFF
ncbi:hypothetical protein M0804_013297 [Polistes exclamans]|nr:hypothetical protein M0804_013297 [Polistes exclamans]